MQTQITEWRTALMTSLAAVMGLFFSASPKLLGFLAILVVGWLLATGGYKGVAALFRAIKFNDLAQRAGLADFMTKTGAQTDSAELFAARWRLPK